MTRRDVRVLVLLLALGFVVRLVHLQTALSSGLAGVEVQVGDARSYWEWSQQIVDGDWWGRDAYHPFFDWMASVAPRETWYRWWGGGLTFHQAPLYPYGVAAVRAVVGNSLATVLFVQVCLGVVHLWLVFRLGTRLFGVRAGLAATALCAWYGPLIFHQTLILRDWLVALLDTLALVALLKADEARTVRWWVLAGVSLGLAYAAKTTIVLFVVALPVWIVWRHRPSLSAGLRACLLVGAGMLAAVSPIILRNVEVGAPPWSLSTRTAEGIVIGNAADGDPIGLFVAPPSLKGIMERAQGRTGATLVETLRTFNGDPVRFVGFQFLKLRGLLNPYEIPNSDNFVTAAEVSPLLRVTLGYGAMLVLGLAGLLMVRPDRPQGSLVYLWLGMLLLGLWMQPIRARYRLVLVPGLAVFAAAWILHVEMLVRRRVVPDVVRAGGLLVILGAGLYGGVAISGDQYYVSTTEDQLWASQEANEGRLQEATERIERLCARVRASPALASHLPRCRALQTTYETRWAMDLINHGHQEQGRKLAGKIEQVLAEGVEATWPHYDLGRMYLMLGDREKAGTFLKRYLETEPDGVTADHVRSLLAGLSDTTPDQAPFGPFPP